MEIIAVELESQRNKKYLVCVCYRPPNCDLKDWLNLFAALLQVADNYQKILITGDFNFPDLTWNLNIMHTPIISSASKDFQELVYDFPSANEHVPNTIPQYLGPYFNKRTRIHR